MNRRRFIGAFAGSSLALWISGMQLLAYLYTEKQVAETEQTTNNFAMKLVAEFLKARPKPD